MGIAEVILKVAKFAKNAKAGNARSVGEYIANKTGFTDFAKEVAKRNNAKIPYKEKIADLKTDSGLTESYITNLIESAKSPKPLYAIREYLKSEGNDLPKDITKKLLNEIGKRMHKFTKSFVENFDVSDLF